jgi:hypothetical protein
LGGSGVTFSPSLPLHDEHGDTLPMTPDECLNALHRAGWSVGVARFGSTVVVYGSNGENVVRAAATTEAEAWRTAVEQAWALGMLRRWACGGGSANGLRRPER